MEEKKLEYYTIKPKLTQYYGVKVNEETVFDEETDDGCVKQHFENLTLTTTVKKKKEADDNNPYAAEEESKMTIKMPSGTILIWTTEEGFILPQYEMTTLSELEEEIKDFKNIYKDSKV